MAARGNPARINIVEAAGHPAPHALENRFRKLTRFRVCTSGPSDDLLRADCDALVLNNLPRDIRLPEDQILQFVESGRGLLCLHDSVFPDSCNPKIPAAAGVRFAYDAIVQLRDGEASVMALARAEPGDPLRRFVIRPVKENSAHPVLRDVRDFEIADEVWAQNVAPGVTALLWADVGDRIPCHPRFRQAVPVCGCTTYGRGRIFFLSIGHFAETYTDDNVLHLLENGLRWLAGDLPEQWDLFLSFSSRDAREAEAFARLAHEDYGVTVFLSAKDLEPGDLWQEEVRRALLLSREVCVLITPSSLQSEWVTTEWGAGWALGKTITPVLLRCDVSQLPERLRALQVVDYHDQGRYFAEVKARRAGV